jgi:hypothetical protein
MNESLALNSSSLPRCCVRHSAFSILRSSFCIHHFTFLLPTSSFIAAAFITASFILPT